jgi:hypothetical protein
VNLEDRKRWAIFAECESDGLIGAAEGDDVSDIRLIVGVSLTELDGYDAGSIGGKVVLWPHSGPDRPGEGTGVREPIRPRPTERQAAGARTVSDD